MKVREAIEILRQMNPDKEVNLTFGGGDRVRDYSDCQPGSSIPGESQEERFGYSRRETSPGGQYGDH